MQWTPLIATPKAVTALTTEDSAYGGAGCGGTRLTGADYARPFLGCNCAGVSYEKSIASRVESGQKVTVRVKSSQAAKGAYSSQAEKGAYSSQAEKGAYSSQT